MYWLQSIICDEKFSSESMARSKIQRHFSQWEIGLVEVFVNMQNKTGTNFVEMFKFSV